MQADDQATPARSDDAAAPAAQRKPGFSGAPLGKLGAAGDRPWLVTLESLLVPGIAVAVGVAFNPEDPLGGHAEFHWAWLAPVIVALRYGPLAGLASGVSRGAMRLRMALTRAATSRGLKGLTT